MCHQVIGAEGSAKGFAEECRWFVQLEPDRDQTVRHVLEASIVTEGREQKLPPREAESSAHGPCKPHMLARRANRADPRTPGLSYSAFITERAPQSCWGILLHHEFMTNVRLHALMTGNLDHGYSLRSEQY